MKTQVIVIHGGNTFKTYKAYLAYLKKSKFDFKRFTREGWKENLRKDLGKNFEVVLMNMPNPSNARYDEWKILFRKLIPFLKGQPIFIGHSLGGMFLAKYLSENRFPKKIQATFLIAVPYGKAFKKSFVDFTLPKNLTRFQKQGGEIFLYQSEDDPLVPFSHVRSYHKKLPRARPVLFKTRGHFNQESLPELVKNIKSLGSN